MKENKKLTPRQWKLLNYLRNSGRKNVVEIAHDLGYELDLKAKSHNPCYELCIDADSITFSSETDKIILHDRKYNFWLAENVGEANDFIERVYLYPALRKLKKYWQIKGFVSLDNQGRFIDLKGNVIDDDSLARRYIKPFNEKED